MSIKPKLPAFIRMLAFFLCLLSLTILAGINAKGVLAEYFAISPRHLLTMKDSQTWSNRDDIYARGLASINYALKWQAENPALMDIKGRLLIERCRYWDKNPQWQQCQQQALDVLRKATAQNMHSAYLWANLLLSKYNLRQFDEEFNEALQKSRALGRNELGVNRTVAYVGIVEWNGWDAEQKELFQQAMFSLQEISPVEARRVALSSGKIDLYCYWTRNDPTQHYSCRLKNYRKPKK